jgi:hypothetical protein
MRKPPVGSLFSPLCLFASRARFNTEAWHATLGLCLIQNLKISLSLSRGSGDMERYGVGRVQSGLLALAKLMCSTPISIQGCGSVRGGREWAGQKKKSLQFLRSRMWIRLYVYVCVYNYMYIYMYKYTIYFSLYMDISTAVSRSISLYCCICNPYRDD